MSGSRKLGLALVAAALVLVGGAGVARAAEQPPVVPSLDPARTSALWQRLTHRPRTRTGAAALACRPMRAVFYAATDWLRLATKLAAAGSPCVQYYVSVPPLTSDKTQLRSDQAWRVRALGPGFHALAEISVPGWTSWVASHGGSWYAAGVEARRRMAAAGYNVALGDTWAVNELSSAVRQGVGSARANMRQLMRGLYDGGGGSALPTKGVVFVSGMSQALTDVSLYQARLQDWLQDAPFWADMSTFVSDWAQELYGDFRNYGVAGSPLAQRRDSLNDYLQHELALANAAPDAAATARAFLQSTYSPLANAAWSYTSAFGWTAVPFDEMQDYVSAQMYAVRHASAQSPLDRGGFAWAPKNPGLSSWDFNNETGVVLDRLAAAIRDSGETIDPGDPGVGACGPAGQNLWCTAGIGGAWFNASWKLLAAWRPSLLVFTTPAQTLAAGATSAPVSVQLQTSIGAPLTATSPLTVTVATSSPRGQFAPAPSGPWTPTLPVTIGVGSATSPGFYYRDKGAGNAVLTVSATGKQSGTQTETVNPGPLAALKVAPAAVTMAPGDQRPFTARGVDAFGNLVSAPSVSWSVGAGTPGSVSPASGPSTTFVAGATPGSGTVVAIVATASGTLTANAAVTVAPAAAVTAIAYGAVGADVVVTLSVRDAAGAPVAGAAISFSVQQGTAPYATASATTGSDGNATYTLTAPPAGCYTTTVTGVTAAGHAWDFRTPPNQICH